MGGTQVKERRGPAVLVGDRQFYRKVLVITLPIMAQNGITNFVNMLDNIMVGQIGTEQMSGVAIVDQLMFAFNICVLGIVAGAGILSAQFYGSQNNEGIRDTFRFKLICCIAIAAAAILLFILGGSTIIGWFLHEGSNIGDLDLTLQYGMSYLKVIVIGMIPYALTQAYAGTLRETGQTMVPMLAGIAAITVNLILNYILIFGKFGAPALGVVGAAIATTVSRYVELLVVAVWTHTHKDRNPFIKGVYRHFRIPMDLVRQITVVSLPLFANEVMWALGMTMTTQCYSLRGLDVVAAVNISNTIGNLFNIVFISMGNAVGIIIGQLLGAGRLKQARREDAQLIAFSVVCCAVTGLIMFAIAPAFPQLYNTDLQVQELAAKLIRISALCMPIFGFTNTAYFTLRAGGRTRITFLFDSCFMWVCNIPVVFCLSRFTNVYITIVFLTGQLIDLIKCVIGFILVKKGIWIQNIVIDDEGAQDR